MEKKKKEKKNSELKLEDVGLIDLPKLDLTAFVGSKVKIEIVEIMDGNWGPYLKLSTEPLADLQDDNQLRATKILGIAKDKDGKYGWSEDTKLGKYLEKKRVKSLKELKGLEVTTIIELDKENNERLTFV